MATGAPDLRDNTEVRGALGCHDDVVRPTLLIVDDHTGFRSLARALLEAEGFDVVGEAVDGASAMQAAARLDPDVVLLDVMLPDTDGFDVCERLLAAGRGRPTVVLTSSRDADAYADRLSTTSASGFVPKEELSGAVLHSLGGTR